MLEAMVPEAPLESTDQGLVPTGEGWFVVNAREASWRHVDGRSAIVDFEGETEFPQLGINLSVLEPGISFGMYHWEADVEDFLILAGEAVLVIEGEERPLRQWDFVHCPPGTKHMIVGAGDTPCLVLAVGARDLATGSEWGAYIADETAKRHGVSVEEDTNDPSVAYADFPSRKPTPYREGWLPDY
jgi:uncharacterized cupin superfamily protein